jgi:hypothetical protein
MKISHGEVLQVDEVETQMWLGRGLRAGEAGEIKQAEEVCTGLFFLELKE